MQWFRCPGFLRPAPAPAPSDSSYVSLVSAPRFSYDLYSNTNPVSIHKHIKRSVQKAYIVCMQCVSLPCVVLGGCSCCQPLCATDSGSSAVSEGTDWVYPPLHTSSEFILLHSTQKWLNTNNAHSTISNHRVPLQNTYEHSGLMWYWQFLAGCKPSNPAIDRSLKTAWLGLALVLTEGSS